MAYLIGIDVGTGGVKTIAVNESGTIVARSFHEYPLSQPKPGWTEQNPNDWWQATLKSLQDVAQQLGSGAKDVKGIGLSGQMHSSVFLDAERNVIRPAILWNDGRTAPQCRWITQKVGREALIQHTSNPALEGFTAPKIVWLMQNEPENYAKVRWVLLPKDYIRMRLTGEIYTEISDAAGTLLLDVSRRIWSETVMEKLGIDPEIMPPIRESIDVCGTLTNEIAEATGLPAGIVVAGGGADNACGAVGAGIVKSGRALSSIGTSGVVLVQTDEPRTDPEGKVHTFNHAIPHRWYNMGVSLSAGLSLKWFRDTLGHLEKQMETLSGIDAYDLLTKQAASIPPGSEGLLFLPYLTGERTPHADANARGVFFGISARHTKGHLIRAVLEGVVFALRDSLEIIKGMGTAVEEIRAIGGGAKSSLWRQIQADILSVNIATLNIDEGPAFGAALLAGVAAGVYGSVTEAAESSISIVEVTEPNPKTAEIYDEYYQAYRALYPALKEEFARLSQLTQKG